MTEQLKQVIFKIVNNNPIERTVGLRIDFINLEDVLIALQNSQEQYQVGVGGGVWVWNMGHVSPCGVGWQLGKPLHEQSEEFISWLNDIL